MEIQSPLLKKEGQSFLSNEHSWSEPEWWVGLFLTSMPNRWNKWHFWSGSIVLQKKVWALKSDKPGPLSRPAPPASPQLYRRYSFSLSRGALSWRMKMAVDGKTELNHTCHTVVMKAPWPLPCTAEKSGTKTMAVAVTSRWEWTVRPGCQES